MKLFQGGKDVNVEILSIMAEGEPLKLIERAGRTAYQSQDKINDVSAKKFVTMLRNLGHESVLEHSAMTVRFSNCSRGLTHELVRHRLAALYPGIHPVCGRAGLPGRCPAKLGRPE